MLLLDSQENYKAAVYHSFNSTNVRSINNNNNNSNNRHTLLHEFELNSNRTKQTAKALFQYLVNDLPRYLVQQTFDIAIEASESVSSSFNLKLFVTLVLLLGFILIGIAVAWRLFACYIENFNFQEFQNRKSKFDSLFF